MANRGQHRAHNHNGGLKRTPYGTLADLSRLEPVFTRAYAEENSASCPYAEWTDDLWQFGGNLGGNGLVGR